MRPSITYCESVYILSGQLWGIVSAVTIIAAISPIWFDCSSPGTRSHYGFVPFLVWPKPNSASAACICFSVFKAGSICVGTYLLVP